MTSAQSSLQKLSISNLNIGSSRKSHFHGKVNFKAELPEKMSAGKSFRVAHVNFQDENSEIRMSFYDGQIEQHYAPLELNKSYDVSKFMVVPSEMKYTLLNHEFELRPLAGKVTKITPLSECAEVKTTPVEPCRIVDVETVEKDELIDILGVLSDVGQLEESTVASSRKRVIRLRDQSECEIEATLWGTAAEEFDGAEDSVISAKRLKTSDFRGHSLSSSQYSSFEFNPNLPETKNLQDWYATAKSSLQFRSLSTGVYKRQTLLESINTEKATDFFLANVSIKSIDKKRDPFYMACNQCFKKVVEQENGTFLCNGGKCNPQETFCWRVILKVKLQDSTGLLDADCFTDAAEKLLDLKVDAARALYEEKTSEFFARLNSLTGRHFEIKFRSKVTSNGV